MYVVVLADNKITYGPFHNEEKAIDYAKANFHGRQWFVAPLID